MMADDAEIDDEIERQLEADAQERIYYEQPIPDDKDIDVSEYFNSSIQKTHKE